MCHWHVFGSIWLDFGHGFVSGWLVVYLSKYLLIIDYHVARARVNYTGYVNLIFLIN